VKVELGNNAPRAAGAVAPAVTYVNVPEEYTYVVEDSAATLGERIRQAVAGGGGITHEPDQEAIISVAAAWAAEGAGQPTWVWSDNPDFVVALAAFFNCPIGRPPDVEMTHYTAAGAPGNLGPDAEALAAIAVANEPSTNGGAPA
jgi:hypothetical protein